MKTLARLLGAVTASVIVTLLIGCNTASQKFSTTTGPDGTVSRTTQGKIWNVLNAKQSVSDFRGQNGEVQTFGTGAATQEALGVEMVKEVRGMATDLLSLYMGKQAVGGTSAAGTIAAITEALNAGTMVITNFPSSTKGTNGSSFLTIPGVGWTMEVTTNGGVIICLPNGKCFGIQPTTK